MTTRAIKKSLIAKQDLLLGKGTAVQTRNGLQYPVDKLDLVMSADSIADLSGLVGDYDGQKVSVKGYHAGSDVGGGIFYWDSSRTGENNGGTVFNGWVRSTNGESDASWFGAVEGGDIYAPVVAAYNILGAAKPIKLPFGSVTLSQPLVLNALKLFGDRQVTVSPTGNHKVFDIRGAGYLGNIKIQTTSIPDYSADALVWRTGLGALQNIHLWDNLVILHHHLNRVAGNIRITSLESDGDSSAGGYMAYCTASGATIRYGNIGFELEVPALGGSFLQGNTFANLNIAAKQQFEMTGPNTIYNSFPGYFGQFLDDAAVSSVQGSFQGSTVDSTGAQFIIQDRSDFVGFLDPLALRLLPGQRGSSATGPWMRVRDGMVEEAHGWKLDIFNDGGDNRLNGSRMGIYEMTEYCEGAALSNKWQLVNANQSPLGVVDTRQNNGIIISAPSGASESIVRMPNVAITGTRYPRMLAFVRERQGGDFSAIASSHSKTGFLNTDQTEGVFVKTTFNATNNGGLVQLVVVKAGVESAFTFKQRSDGTTNFPVFYADKLFIEIVYGDGKIDAWITKEAFDGINSYAENRVYNRDLTRAGFLSVPNTDPNFPTPTIPVFPSFVQSANINNGRAMLHFAVKCRYAK
jgi:hypothetical protein